MVMSIVLAKILGLYFLSIGAAFLLSPDRLRKVFPLVMKDEGFLFLGGILALLIGAVMISLHNTWVLGWPVIITILGWWSLSKGLMLIICPSIAELFSFIQNRSDSFYRVISIIYFAFGLFLAYEGFFFGRG